MQTLVGNEAPDKEAKETGTSDVYPDELAEQERKLVEARRRDLHLTDSTAQVGVALSGGGIRSATFSLGLFQSLAQHDLVKHIDYLSTVSGGGYFGGFFGKLFLSSGPAGTPASTAQQARDTLADSQSPPVSWLRENGRYIAPKGNGDYFFAAATYLRNWAAVQYIIGISLLTLFLLANTLRAWTWTTQWGVKLEVLVSNTTLPHIWASPWLAIPAAIAAFILIPLCSAFWLTQKHQGTGLRPLRQGIVEFNYPLLGLLLSGALAAGALLAPPWPILDWIPQGTASRVCCAYLIIVSILSLLLYILSGLQAPKDYPVVVIARNRLSRWLGSALLVFLMLTAFGLVDSIGQTVYALSTTQIKPVLFTGLATGVLVLLARQFAGYLSKDPSKAPALFRIPAQFGALAAGLLLALIVAIFWTAISHAILWQGETPHGDPGGQISAFYSPSRPTVSLNHENHIVVSSSSVQATQLGKATPALELTSIALLIGFAISLLTGKTMTFLNLSSIQEFYASRLSRAYLGASNPRRTGFTGPQTQNDGIKNRTAADVTKVVPHDDVMFSEYRPELNGGPLHLINVTINETVSGTSQLEQRDRKGLGMAVGPCGISIARIHHAVWQEKESDRRRQLRPIPLRHNRFSVFNTGITKVESLSLGQWVAVSGAAFSTGLGARTNIGMSLLLGLSNVRIGYWWDSGITPSARAGKKSSAIKQKHKLSDLLEPFFSAQVYLSDEFLARFHGPHRQRWYLSDGGHYENTAVYELIRRRLPLIIASDNGCDQEYVFDDIANLIRKARLDFNAEIRFLDEKELDKRLDAKLRGVIGTPAELQRRVSDARSPDGNKRLQETAYSSCHALLARVHYDGNPEAESLLLWIKPSLTGDEPLDLLEYHAQHPEFPQQSTLDQFFDEAQWESYRKLGSYIGDSLFDSIPSLNDWAKQLLKQQS